MRIDITYNPYSEWKRHCQEMEVESRKILEEKGVDPTTVKSRGGMPWWFFYFKRYRYIKGFMLRVFGIYFNIRESNATDKLINIAKEKKIVWLGGGTGRRARFKT